MASKSFIFRFDDVEVHEREFKLVKAGGALAVEPKAFRVLLILLRNPGKLIGKEDLLNAVWGDAVVTDNSLARSVGLLRRLLGDEVRDPRYIETVATVGYRFIGKVEVTEDAAGSLQTGTWKNGSAARELGTSAADRLGEEKGTPAVQAEPPPAPRRNARRTVLLVAGGSMIVLVMVAIYLDWTRFGWGQRFLKRDAKLQVESLAVIPLENLSGDPGQDYLADGMTDELITMLAKNSTLRVISRTSVMQYKGVHRPVRDIARELDVDGILEGSIARSGNAVHLALQLIHAPTDTHMWAESYDRETSDSVSLPDEAARTIATRLGKVKAGERVTRYISPQAHDAYIRGIYYLNAGNYAKAIETFKAAVELQPDYALAWNELAMSYGWSMVRNRPSEGEPKFKAAMRKALELDDSLAEAHNNVAGDACFYGWDWNLALKESARTIEIDPNYSFGHFIRSRVLLTQNRLDESLEEMKKSQELDPLADPGNIVYQLILMHRFDAALDAAKPIVESQPDNNIPHSALGYLYSRQGRLHEAANEMLKDLFPDGDKNAPAARRLASGPDGYNAVLRLKVRILQEKAVHEYVPQMDLADLYGLLGDREGTLRSLENAFKDRHARIVWMQATPWFDFVHLEERYRAIVRQVGLPPAY